MQKGCLYTLFFVLALIIGVLAYLLGKKNASKTIDNIAMNRVLVQQIAELSSLEVQGNASIKSTNIQNDGTISDEFKKLFMERTLNITVPYVAKYGVDLGKQNINIEEKNKQVYVVLPDPQLLSYELRLDKVNAMTRKGLFETGNEEAYNKAVQKLYSQSRSQLENSPGYKQQAREKIRSIIESYYAPMNLKVEVRFTNELKSKVTDERQ